MGYPICTPPYYSTFTTITPPSYVSSPTSYGYGYPSHYNHEQQLPLPYSQPQPPPSYSPTPCFTFSYTPPSPNQYTSSSNPYTLLASLYSQFQPPPPSSPPHPYSQPTGAYQHPGAPYQPTSSFQNSGSASYSSTYNTYLQPSYENTKPPLYSPTLPFHSTDTPPPNHIEAAVLALTAKLDSIAGKLASLKTQYSSPITLQSEIPNAPKPMNMISKHSNKDEPLAALAFLPPPPAWETTRTPPPPKPPETAAIQNPPHAYVTPAPPPEPPDPLSVSFLPSPPSAPFPFRCARSSPLDSQRTHSGSSVPSSKPQSRDRTVIPCGFRTGSVISAQIHPPTFDFPSLDKAKSQPFDQHLLSPNKSRPLICGRPSQAITSVGHVSAFDSQISPLTRLSPSIPKDSARQLHPTVQFYLPLDLPDLQSSQPSTKSTICVLLRDWPVNAATHVLPFIITTVPHTFFTHAFFSMLSFHAAATYASFRACHITAPPFHTFPSNTVLISVPPLIAPTFCVLITPTFDSYFVDETQSKLRPTSTNCVLPIIGPHFSHSHDFSGPSNSRYKTMDLLPYACKPKGQIAMLGFGLGADHSPMHSILENCGGSFLFNDVDVVLFKQWDPGKIILWANFYNLEDKVGLDGVWNDRNSIKGSFGLNEAAGPLQNDGKPTSISHARVFYYHCKNGILDPSND